MKTYVVKPLDKNTWSDFARLVERHNGIWGGCWCIAFHAEGPGQAGGVLRSTDLTKDAEFGKAKLTPLSYTTGRPA